MAAGPAGVRPPGVRRRLPALTLLRSPSTPRTGLPSGEFSFTFHRANLHRFCDVARFFAAANLHVLPGEAMRAHMLSRRYEAYPWRRRGSARGTSDLHAHAPYSSFAPEWHLRRRARRMRGREHQDQAAAGPPRARTARRGVADATWRAVARGSRVCDGPPSQRATRARRGRAGGVARRYGPARRCDPSTRKPTTRRRPARQSSAETHGTSPGESDADSAVRAFRCCCSIHVRAVKR